MLRVLALVLSLIFVSVDSAAIVDAAPKAPEDRFFFFFFGLANCRNVCAAAAYAATTTCRVGFFSTFACNLTIVGGPG